MACADDYIRISKLKKSIISGIMELSDEDCAYILDQIKRRRNNENFQTQGISR